MQDWQVLVMNDDRDDYVPVEPAEVYCRETEYPATYIGLSVKK